MDGDQKLNEKNYIFINGEFKVNYKHKNEILLSIGAEITLFKNKTLFFKNK